MGKGRKSIAAEIKEKLGSFDAHPGRRNTKAPKADGNRPKMPADFDTHEKQKWDEMCATLEANGILSSDLTEILTAYCTAFGGWMRARQAVQKLGLVLIDGTDIKRNPFSVELHKYRDDMNRLLPEFGLTPASRQKVSPKESGEAEESPFKKIMDRMGRG